MYDHAGVKVHVMPCAFGGAEAGGWFAKEIKSKNDLKGLRMRIFGLGARVMSGAGATTVLIPGSKIASAFDKKEIDAAELYTPAVDIDQPFRDKVKLIYIDPPYNTGKDFIYPDNFQENIKNYLELTGQIVDGVKLSK